MFENLKKEKFVTLVLTHQCNLRCSYCYEKHKDNMKMSFDTATKIIDDEFEKDDGSEFIEFDLFGGEPFLEYDLIKSLVEYTKNRMFTKNYIFFITTNGVLLDDDKKEWLKANTKYLQCCLSLDGTRDMHNVNRSNSFDLIDIDFFVKTYPEQEVKMTISNKTLPFLAEGVIFCHKLGLPVSCNLAYGIDWSDSKNQNILTDQLILLMDFYLDNPQYYPCLMLDPMRILNLCITEQKQIRVCGAGYTMRAYDYDGSYYPCQHFLPLSVGQTKAKQSLLIEFPELDIKDRTYDSSCSSCSISNICMTCFGANYAATGNIYQPDVNMCQLFKIQFKATAYFTSLLFKKGILEDYCHEKSPTVLKSALMIDRLIKI